ncbi:FMN-binding negative transcriptional regulator [Arsenicicoccus piscis]|nr:FMN-binding negative transcriptional regulator [Arsenicicoccus piscis]MCH8627239.1 FMN-binding negative transcriptional regulator [Arsenicicoccus piscis]
MHIPPNFSMDDEEVRDLLRHMGSADLVTSHDRGLVASYLPFHHDPSVGERGALRGYVSRANDQWWEPRTAEAMVIVHGPAHYVSPSWYASRSEPGRVVPTWDHVTVHLYGHLVAHEDPAWIEQTLRVLTDRHESGLDAPWRLEDAPRDHLDTMLRGLVGVELVVSRWEAKAKMSQNRSPADIRGVIAALDELGDQVGADYLQRVSLPVAVRRDETLRVVAARQKVTGR